MNRSTSCAYSLPAACENKGIMRAFTSTWRASRIVRTNRRVGSCESTSIVNSMNRSQKRTASRSTLSPASAPSQTVKKSSTSSGNHVASGVSAMGTGGGLFSFAAFFAALACFFCK